MFKSKYSISYGGKVPAADGGFEYDNIAETGPFKTRLGAVLSMRAKLGKDLAAIPVEYRLPDSNAEYDTPIMGATIERFTDAEGTQEGWDYTPTGKLADHWSNH
jgi:hypothetical protein